MAHGPPRVPDIVLLSGGSWDALHPLPGTGWEDFLWASGARCVPAPRLPRANRVPLFLPPGIACLISESH